MADALRALSVKDLWEALDRLYSSTLAKHLRTALVATAVAGEGKAKVRATQRLRMRSGNLRDSIKASVVQDSAGVPAILLQAGGEKAGAYASVQEHPRTHTITPKRSKYLAIPVGPSLTATGRARFGPRDAPVPLRAIPSRRGGLVLVDATSPNGGVYFVLKRSVRVRGVSYLGDTVKELREQVLPKRLAAALQAAAQEATNGGQ